MKLAEALILRADHQTRLAQLKNRLKMVARVQEGDQPAEDPQALIAELERTAENLVALIQQINRTNSVTTLETGLTLSDALAVRDVMGQRHAFYRDLAQRATITQDRYSRSEVKFQSTLDVAALQQQADQIAREYRELDTRIQSANWLTDLIE